MRIRLRFAGCVAIAALGVGCGKKQKEGTDGLPTVDGPVAEAEASDVIPEYVCAAYEACDCGEIAGVSLDGCDFGLSFSWQAFEDRARELNLTYDGDCVADRINAMADRGCALPAANAIPFCTGETCLVWHGTKPEGEECEGGFSSSDCQQGLVCLGTCQKPCANSGVDIPEGEVCRDEEIQFYGFCAEGLLCDPQSGLCLSLPTEGEPCLSGICAEGLWCEPGDGDTTCQPTRATGGDCTVGPQCQTGNCADQKCVEPWGEGENCAGGVCAEGLVCTPHDDGTLTCVRSPTLGEACSSDPRARCAEGLVCSDEKCANRPGKGQSCTPGEDGIPLTCADGLICGVKLCRVTPDAPGCAACQPDDDSCRVYVCGEIPPAVCGDSGGLLY